MDQGYAKGSVEEALVKRLQDAFFTELQHLIGMNACADLPFYNEDPERAFKAFVPFFIAYERASASTGIGLGTFGEPRLEHLIEVDPAKAN